MPFFSRSALKDGVAMREVWSWAAFDFANSGYTTVVLTAVFNAYFVSVVAGDAPSATFLWTVVIAVSNAVSMLLMPVIGTVADATATKKRWLAVATFMAVGGTLGLMFAGPGTIVWASLMIIVSNVAYNVGESLNSAFLPELAREDAVGKVSGWGWSFGYCGGILTLGLCLGVVLGGEKLGYGMDQTVAGTMAVTAFVFAAAALHAHRRERQKGEHEEEAREKDGHPVFVAGDPGDGAVGERTDDGSKPQRHVPETIELGQA